MKNAFTTNTALIISILLSVFLFSCQQEEDIVTVKNFKKKLNGTWEIESIVSDTTTEVPLFTHIDFDKDGFFKASNGNTIVTSGEYAAGDRKEFQMLVLATEEGEMISYWIEDYTDERMGLIPVEDGLNGNTLFYDKK